MIKDIKIKRTEQNEIITGISHQLDFFDKNTLIELLLVNMTSTQKQKVLAEMENLWYRETIISLEENGVIETPC